jgi:hypothetical protein
LPLTAASPSTAILPKPNKKSALFRHTGVFRSIFHTVEQTFCQWEQSEKFLQNFGNFPEYLQRKTGILGNSD